jgi:SAM-dependent methyltransferase
MRESESKYWDHVALNLKGIASGNINDNILKRCEVVRRILAHRPEKAKVLEIGAGLAMAAQAVNTVLLGNFHYIGTDVSPEFCKYVEQKFRFTMYHADILQLPACEGGFDMVWAFDTLEHVRPEDRAAGYLEIGRVLAPHGVVLLNLPLDDCGHLDEFDHGITDQDAAELAKAIGGRISKWEVYRIEEQGLTFAWVEIVR